MIGYVYEIRCIDTGKIYIGSSIKPELRWRQHRSKLNLGKHDNCFLQRAWRKYGADHFRFTVLACVHPDASLIELEQQFIDRLSATDSNVGFNICAVANRVSFTDAVRSKMSLARRRRTMKPVSEETKRKISEAKSGKPRSAQHSLNLSKARAGVPVKVFAATRNEIRASHAGGMGMRAIGRKFAIHHSTVAKIVSSNG